MLTRAVPLHGVVAGVFWMVLTTFCFVGVTGIVRYLGSQVPAVEAAFLRYLAGALIMLPLMRGLLRRPPTARAIRLHVLRGVLHGGAVMLWFYAMARIPIAQVTALGYVSPIFVTIGAALFLGERLYLRRIGAIIVGLMGALVILRPGFQEISLGQLAQLGAAPLFAASFLLAKGLTGHQSDTTIVGMLSIFCTLTLLPGAVMNWQPPSAAELFWLTVTAALATLGHFTMTRAFRAAPITVTQPITILQLVWATILGIIAFGEPADPFVILGGLMVVGAASFISHREAVAARRAITPPAQATKG